MKNKKTIDEMTAADATHYIECRHCLNGKSCYEYTMRCLPLCQTKSGYTKIILFGDRASASRQDKKSIRYIKSYRLKHLIK